MSQGTAVYKGGCISSFLRVFYFLFFNCLVSFLLKSISGMQETAVVNSGLLLMAVMGLLFPAVLHYTHTEVHFGKSELALSRFSSCIMLVAYAAYLFFQLKSHKNLYDPVNEVGYPPPARHTHTRKKLENVGV